MASSLDGHVDIVRMLIGANVQINRKNKVCCSYLSLEITLTTHHCIELQYNSSSTM